MENIETIAEKYINGFNKGNWISDDNLSLGFPNCLKKLAEKNKNLFKRLVDSYLDYSNKVNEGNMDKEDIKMEALSFVESLCVIGDTGRMTIGIPAGYNLNGIARKTLLDIYSGQLAEDNNYEITHRIRI